MGSGRPAADSRTVTPSAVARPIRLAVQLFPAPWRDRYGPEFAALLEATPFTPRVLFDVLVAAADAHLDPSGQLRRWPPMIERMRLSELRVFASWVLFVVAGLAFQRMTEGPPLAPLAAGRLAVGMPLVVLIGAAVASLAAVLLAGVPIAAAIALTAARTGRWRLIGLLAVPPASLAVWLVITFVLVSLGSPPAADPLRVVAFLVWVGVFLAAAFVSVVAVSAAARNGQVDGSLYRRAGGLAVITAVTIGIGAIATAGWGVAVLLGAPDAFWGSDGLVGSSTALSWLGVTIVMAIAAGLASRSALTIRRILAAE